MSTSDHYLKSHSPLPVENGIQFLRKAELLSLQGALACYKNKEGFFHIQDIVNLQIKGLPPASILKSLRILHGFNIFTRLQIHCSNGFEDIHKLVPKHAVELNALLESTEGFGFYKTERNLVLMAQKAMEHNGLLLPSECREFIDKNPLRNHITNNREIIYATQAKGCAGYLYHVTEKGERVAKAWQAVSEKLKLFEKTIK